MGTEQGSSANMYAEKFKSKEQATEEHLVESINDMSKEKDLSETIANVKSFDDLFDVIDVCGGMQGSKDFFSAERLKDCINKVRRGELLITVITEMNGLRKAVDRLLNEEIAAQVLANNSKHQLE